MAGWPWFYEAVVSDHDTADTAIDELGFCAVSLGEALALLTADIPSVVDGWEGLARRAFDDEMPGILEAGYQLASMLLAAGVAVGAAYESSAREIDLRAQLRADHERELAEAGR
jgi:uncharacterized protein YukE